MTNHKRCSTVIAALAVGLGVSPTAAAPEPGKLVYVTGSTKKVAQLTGDFDRERGKPTLSQTGKRFGVFGTDLGSSFEHHGRLFFLFGDTWGRPGDWDAVAWTDSKNPAKIRLDFYMDKDGKWLPPIVPGIAQGGFDVPSGGVSVGGKVYVVFTTDWNPGKGDMGRSVLAVSEDDGKTFQALYDLSTTKFINVSFWESGGWLYIYGSGPYRKSSVFLARIKPAELANRSQMRYFGGVGADGKPQWSARESEAAPFFHHDVVGEFSVAYCKPVKRFVMLYNSPAPRGITLRSALSPWGPWSEGETIFDPWRDGGYGHFMHIPSDFKTDKPDVLSDPGREAMWGGEYGPYIMTRYTTGGKGRCRIFYSLSTWNPYQAMVMQTDLKLETPRKR